MSYAMFINKYRLRSEKYTYYKNRPKYTKKFHYDMVGIIDVLNLKFKKNFILIINLYLII